MVDNISGPPPLSLLVDNAKRVLIEIRALVPGIAGASSSAPAVLLRAELTDRINNLEIIIDLLSTEKDTTHG